MPIFNLACSSRTASSRSLCTSLAFCPSVTSFSRRSPSAFFLWTSSWYRTHLPANAAVDRRKKEVTDGQKANEVHKERLDAVREEQARLKIGIKDGYESLKRAKQEILSNK